MFIFIYLYCTVQCVTINAEFLQEYITLDKSVDRCTFMDPSLIQRAVTAFTSKQMSFIYCGTPLCGSVFPNRTESTSCRNITMSFQLELYHHSVNSNTHVDVGVKRIPKLEKLEDTSTTSATVNNRVTSSTVGAAKIRRHLQCRDTSMKTCIFEDSSMVSPRRGLRLLVVDPKQTVHLYDVNAKIRKFKKLAFQLQNGTLETTYYDKTRALLIFYHFTSPCSYQLPKTTFFFLTGITTTTKLQSSHCLSKPSFLRFHLAEGLYIFAYNDLIVFYSSKFEGKKKVYVTGIVKHLDIMRRHKVVIVCYHYRRNYLVYKIKYSNYHKIKILSSADEITSIAAATRQGLVYVAFGSSLISLSLSGDIMNCKMKNYHSGQIFTHGHRLAISTPARGTFSYRTCKGGFIRTLELVGLANSRSKWVIGVK